MTPEHFGAFGDGLHDDSTAIQRAFDAAAARPAGGTVILQPHIAYRCDAGLVLDASFVSLWGQGLLDFSKVRDTCLRINASSVAKGATPANNYGHRGMISGALRIRGGGDRHTGIGILFDADATATAAQMLIENCSISGCTSGIVFARHGYNNVMVRCDIFDCGTCVVWQDAEDNGERNTLIGCTLFNSGTAVHIAQSAAALYLESCSIDYTEAVYIVERGAVFATDCHHESSRWIGRPFRCSGDGALIHLNGGTLLGQADRLRADILFEVDTGSSIRIDGIFAHNLALATIGKKVTCWATGPGSFQANRCESYNMSQLPVRMHDRRTSLADPDFTASDWQDPVWRMVDGPAPVTSRYGTGEDMLLLQRSDAGGSLVAVKKSVAGTAAFFVLFCLPVRSGEQVFAGFEIRRDPGRPGSAVKVGAIPHWARLDGHDARRLPVVTRREMTGVLDVEPAIDRYSIVTPMSLRLNRTAPSWATHFLMVVDLTRVDHANLLFRGLWCDTM